MCVGGGGGGLLFTAASRHLTPAVVKSNKDIKRLPLEINDAYKNEIEVSAFLRLFI